MCYMLMNLSVMLCCWCYMWIRTLLYAEVCDWRIISCYYDVWSCHVLNVIWECILCDNRLLYEILRCFMFDKKCVLCLPITSISMASDYFGESCSCHLHLWRSELYLWPLDISEWAAFISVRRLILLWCFYVAKVRFKCNMNQN